MDNSTENQEVQEEITDKVETPEVIEDSGQDVIVPERYSFLADEEISGEKPKEEKPTEEKPEDKPTEEKPKETKDEEEIIYEDDKITFTRGEEKTELIKIDMGDGTFVYAPESLKDGYLRQADYTKKTMAVAEDKKQVESLKEQIEYARNEAFALKYVDELGGLTEQPLEKDYLNPDGKLYNKFETEEQAVEAYKADSQKWLHRAELEVTIKKTIDTNTAMINAFIEKYGEEEYDTVTKEVQKYINPFVFKNVVPYPQDALETLRKGLRYDKDMEEAKKTAKIEALKSFNDKGKTATRTVLKSSHNPTPKEVRTDIPERYQQLMKEIT